METHLDRQLTTIVAQQLAPADMVKAFLHKWKNWTENEEVKPPSEAPAAVKKAIQ